MPPRIRTVLLVLLVSICSSLASPLEIILVEGATRSDVSKWKEEGYQAVAVVLQERTSAPALPESARAVTDAGLDLYYWIEVGRNPEMAAKHPRWMASLGAHPDWLKNFPKFSEPGAGEVAKAFPWVPIAYEESYKAHLARIEQLLERAPSGWTGLFLNDLQGGPSSCGCGNLLCRWAIDYQVPSTATKVKGADVVSRFVTDVKRKAPAKVVIPVWATECSEMDLPTDKNKGQPGTGLCGTVGCATGACPQAFTDQFMMLTSGHSGAIGILGVHTSLHRHDERFGGGAAWFVNALKYVNTTLTANDGKAIAPARLWVVVENVLALKDARELANNAGAGAVIVSKVNIDQSYQPRLIKVN